jgi:hypothetical protein
VKAIRSENTVKGAIVQSNSERFAINAKVVIDASGDGDMAYLSGANCHEYQDHRVGMSFGMSGVNFDKVLTFAAKNEYALVHKAFGEQGEMKGKLVKFGLRLRIMPEFKEKIVECGIHGSHTMTSSHEGEATYINGVNTQDGNVIDPRKATDTIVRLRENIFKSACFLNENIPGFEDAYLNWTSPVMGPRETRYVECEYDITADDIENGVIFEDSIGLFGAQDAHFKGHSVGKGYWYGIPYRSLVPKFVENLLVAGRMITSDWVAHMSTRLVGACFLQGQATGTAAAICAQSGVFVRNVNIQELKEALIADGVCLT